MDSRSAGTGLWRVGNLVADLYRVLDIHGEGAMGLVYRVRHVGWDVDLAVKSPRAKWFRGDEDRERFVREAQTWVELGAHPHVCTCYYVRTIDGVPRVFAEYVTGGSLKSRIDDGSLYEGAPREALERILDIAVQVAWGLAYTHGQGVVHQDVKPGNVLLGKDGTARIIDFGIARARQFGTAEAAPEAGSLRSVLVTQAGMTEAYASPEQSAGQRLSYRTDTWSFAVSVLEMFAGGIFWTVGPAAGESLAEYLAECRHHGPPRPELPAMPEAVGALLGCCLRTDPADRPGSMAAVAAALIEAYEREFGTPYPRKVPDPAQLRADGLNNKALSLLDLGQAQEACEAFARALEIDPQHPQALYNQGLLDWRAGRVGDDELLDRLKLASVGATGYVPGRISILQAQVQLERSRPDEALALLEVAMRKAPRDPAVPVLMSAAGAMLDDRCRPTAEPSAGFELRDGVEVATMTPDARLVLAGGRGGQLVLRDMAAGNHREFAGHRTDVHAVGLSADGTRALSGDREGNVYFWDTATGRRLAELKGHWGLVGACWLSADGRRAVTANRVGTVLWWDTTSPYRPRRVITLERRGLSYRGVYGLAVAADEHTALVTAVAANSHVELWDLPTGQLLQRLNGHSPVAMLPDASHALIADNLGCLLWCDLSGEGTGGAAPEEEVSGGLPARRPRVVRRLAAGRRGSGSAAVSADGRLAVSADRGDVVRWWDLATGRCLRTDADSGQCPASVALSADGHTYALVDRGLVRYGPAPAFGGYTAPYELCRPVMLRELTHRQDQFDELLGAARSATGRQREREAYELLVQARGLPGHERDERALSAWHELSLRLPRAGLRGAWQAGVIRLPGRYHPSSEVRLLADGRRALCADDDGLRLWDLDTGRCLQELADHWVGDVAVSPDQRTALAGFWDGRVEHWDLDTGRCLMTLQVADQPTIVRATGVQAVCFSADGRRFYAAADGQIGGWDLADGSLVTSYQARHTHTDALCASTDGRWLLSCGTGPEVLLRDVADGRTGGVFRDADSSARRTVWQGTERIHHAGLTPDGSRVFASNNDGRVRVWQVDGARLLYTVAGQENPDGTARPMNAVAVSPDGRFAVAGGDDGLVRVLDLNTGRWLWTLSGHTDNITSVDFGGQSRYAVSTGSDGTLRRWELDLDLDPDEVT